MATTKRKFDTLLDRLTASASTTSLASTLRESNTSATSLSHPTTPEHASKRSRLSGIGMDRPRVASGNERIQALKDQLFTPRKEGERLIGAGLRVVGPNKTQAVSPRKPANYQPYSQEQFLARLKTFADVRKWTTKPDAIGEVEWAMRGWSCDTWNTVACKGGCEQRVAVRLRPKRKDPDGKEIDMSEDLTADLDDGLVEKYQELIVSGHHEDCLWRKRGCQGGYLCKSLAPLLNADIDYRRHLPYSDSEPSKEHRGAAQPLPFLQIHCRRAPHVRKPDIPRSEDRGHPQAYARFVL